VQQADEMQRKQQGAEDAERRAQQQAWENAQRTDADARAQGLQMEEDQRQQQELARQERELRRRAQEERAARWAEGHDELSPTDSEQERNRARMEQADPTPEQLRTAHYQLQQKRIEAHRVLQQQVIQQDKLGWELTSKDGLVKKRALLERLAMREEEVWCNIPTVGPSKLSVPTPTDPYLGIPEEWWGNVARVANSELALLSPNLMLPFGNTFTKTEIGLAKNLLPDYLRIHKAMQSPCEKLAIVLKSYNFHWNARFVRKCMAIILVLLNARKRIQGGEEVMEEPDDDAGPSAAAAAGPRFPSPTTPPRRRGAGGAAAAAAAASAPVGADPGSAAAGEALSAT
jgi:hypothetical protein